MAQFPATAEEFEAKVAEFKSEFKAPEDEDKFYQAVLSKVKTYGQVCLQDTDELYFIDWLRVVTVADAKQWIPLLNFTICRVYNYLDVNSDLRNYLIDDKQPLDGCHGVSRLWKFSLTDIQVKNIISRLSYQEIVSQWMSSNISNTIKQELETQAIKIITNEPNVQRNIPLKMRRLTCASIGTHAMNSDIPQQEQKQKPTLPSVQLELQTIAKSTSRDAELIKAQLNDVVTHLATASEQSEQIFVILNELVETIKKLTKK